MQTKNGGNLQLVFLHTLVPLSHAEGNETSSPIAWTHFSLRKSRYGFSVSDYQQGGVPLAEDVADPME